MISWQDQVKSLFMNFSAFLLDLSFSCPQYDLNNGLKVKPDHAKPYLKFFTIFLESLSKSL